MMAWDQQPWNSFLTPFSHFPSIIVGKLIMIEARLCEIICMTDNSQRLTSAGPSPPEEASHSLLHISFPHPLSHERSIFDRCMSLCAVPYMSQVSILISQRNSNCLGMSVVWTINVHIASYDFDCLRFVLPFPDGRPSLQCGVCADAVVKKEAIPLRLSKLLISRRETRPATSTA